MPSGSLAFLNGALVARAAARVAADDRGLLVGDGVFETVRVDSGRALLLNAHLERLYGTLDALLIEIPWPKDALAAQVARLLGSDPAGHGTGRLRITVTRGPGSAGAPTVLVTVDPYTPPGPETYAQGVEVAVSRSLRAAHPLHQVKTTSYAWNLWQRAEADAVGAFEALQFNTEGFVAEGSFTNLFLVDAHGMLRSPLPEEGSLPGVTRAAVLDLAHERTMSVREGGIDGATLTSAREVFLTGSLVEIVPVREVKGWWVAGGDASAASAPEAALGLAPATSACPGPLTRRLMRAYSNLVRPSEMPPPGTPHR